MKARIFFFLMLSLLLFTGCGERHQGKTLIRNFLNQNLTYGDIEEDHYGQLDSTTLVTNERVLKMREATSRLPEFHRNISYGKPTPTLLFITVKYKIVGDQGKEQNYQQTFYMDKELTQIVAFKNN